MKLSTIACSLALLVAGAAGTASSEPLDRKGYVSFQPKVGFVIPTGNYKNVSSSGLGLQGTAEYFVASRWSVGASLNFTRSGAKSAAIAAQEAALTVANRAGASNARVTQRNFDSEVSPTIAGISAATPVSISKWNTKTLQFGAFSRYLIPTGSASLAPFVTAGMGLYNVGGSVTGTGAAQDVLESATGTAGKTSFGVNVGTGLSYGVSPSLGLTGGITYHNAFSSPSTNYFQINTGLNFLFNPGR